MARNRQSLLGSALLLAALAGCSSTAGTSGGIDISLDQPAPPTSGEDVDGRSVKLESFRGKVVLLVFWGSWCPPCMSMVPHERELAERYRDQPFTILGVNSGDDQAAAQLAIESNRMTWPIIWDGGSTEGPIATAWSIEAFPTMFVIDPAGVVRHKIVGAMPDAIDEAVKSELAKVKAK